MILSGKVGRFAWGCGLCPIRTAGLLIDKEETVGFRVRRGGGDVGMMRGGEIGSRGSSSAGAVTPPPQVQVLGMKNQNTGVNILYGELSVRI